MGAKNINILCNSTLAIPILHELIRDGRVQSIAMPENMRDVDAAFYISQIATHATIPMRYISKELLQEQLNRWLSEFPCRAVVCLTFPFKIPATVLAIPEMGFINIHFALLPQYRGAQPIFWEIKNREPQGGITIHRMDEQWDKGNILFQHTIKILPHTTYGQHIGNLTRESVHVVPALLKLVDANNIIQGEKQKQGVYRSKPVYKDVKLNWEENDSYTLMATIKACNPWNKGAFCFVNGVEMRIVDAEVAESFYGKHCEKMGSIVLSPDKSHFVICCKDGRFLKPSIFYTEDGFLTASSLFKIGLHSSSLFH